MKSLKDYIDSIPVQEEMASLDEGNPVKSNPNDPPPVLIMRRKSIRQFPNGQRVALYYVDKLKKYVTVPYDDMQLSLTVKEFVEDIEDDVILQLQEIVSSENTKRIMFEDKTTLVVDRFIASAVLTVYDELSEENKEKVANMLQKGKHQFKEVVEFAKKHVN